MTSKEALRGQESRQIAEVCLHDAAVERVAQRSGTCAEVTPNTLNLTSTPRTPSSPYYALGRTPHSNCRRQLVRGHPAVFLVQAF